MNKIQGCDSDRTWYIYGLFDPRQQDQIRYIGWSFNPQRRLVVHICKAKGDKDNNAWKQRWIRKLLREGIRPEFRILESGTGADACVTAERRWISHLRSSTNYLMNLTDGGDGSAGLAFSDEAKRKISDSWKRRTISDETRRLMSESKSGVPHKPEHSAKISAALKARGIKPPGMGRPFTPEEKQKISETRRRKYQELREKGISLKRGPASEETKRKSSDTKIRRAAERRSRAALNRITASESGLPLFIVPAYTPKDGIVSKPKSRGSKLTMERANEIRTTYAKSGLSQAEIAKQFEVSSATVSAVIRGATWRDYSSMVTAGNPHE